MDNKEGEGEGRWGVKSIKIIKRQMTIHNPGNDSKLEVSAEDFFEKTFLSSIFLYRDLHGMAPLEDALCKLTNEEIPLVIGIFKRAEQPIVQNSIFGVQYYDIPTYVISAIALVLGGEFAKAIEINESGDVIVKDIIAYSIIERLTLQAQFILARANHCDTTSIELKLKSPLLMTDNTQAQEAIKVSYELYMKALEQYNAQEFQMSSYLPTEAIDVSFF